MWVLPQALNFLDDMNMPQVQALIRNCQEELYVDMVQAEDTCAAIMDYIVYVSGEVGMDDAGEFPYDARIFGYDWDPAEQIVKDYFAETNADYTDIMTAIHVIQSTKDPIFEMSSSAVGTAFAFEDTTPNWCWRCYWSCCRNRD